MTQVPPQGFHYKKSHPKCRCNSRLFNELDVELSPSAIDLSTTTTSVRVIRNLVCANCGFKIQWPDEIEIQKIELTEEEINDFTKDDGKGSSNS